MIYLFSCSLISFLWRMKNENKLFEKFTIALQYILLLFNLKCKLRVLDLINYQLLVLFMYVSHTFFF